jgi:hypothetical protein
MVKLWNRFSKWWFQAQTPLYPVAIIRLKESYEPHTEDEESIRSLISHPGFVALNNRLKLRIAALDYKLHQRQLDMREVDRIQLAIEAYNFLQDEVNKAVNKKQEARAVAARPYEQVEFDKVFAHYVGV